MFLKMATLPPNDTTADNREQQIVETTMLQKWPVPEAEHPRCEQFQKFDCKIPIHYVVKYNRTRTP